jgi:predicted porin
VEAKYEFTPELFGALRWNQQFFGDVNNDAGGSTPWDNDTWRIDAAVGYRFTAHTQLKLQYSLQHEDGDEQNFSNLLAVQFTVRF